MKARRLLVIAGAPTAVAVVLMLSVSLYWEHNQSVPQDMPKLITALQAFCGDQSADGSLPPEVSVQELIKGGYLTTDDVRAFEGMEMTFSTHYEDPPPEMILARVLTPDGQLTCLLADGSVQQFSPQTFREYLKISDRRTGP